jgi:hypothetical protein
VCGCMTARRMPQAVLLVGFMAEEVEAFRSFMLDMEADMVKVGACAGGVSARDKTETTLLVEEEDCWCASMITGRETSRRWG